MEIWGARAALRAPMDAVQGGEPWRWTTVNL
jgi:hypothetical protein